MVTDQDKRQGNDGRTCQFCRYSFQDDGDNPTINLRCRRFPPQAGAGFARVLYNDHCFYWKGPKKGYKQMMAALRG